MEDNSKDLNSQVSISESQVASNRRTRLRDFQTKLLERMQSAKAGSHIGASFLGVMIAGERYLIDLREAGEIVASGNLKKVPLTKEWYLGVSNVRGNLTSVIDYSCFVSGKSTPITSSARILSFASSMAFNSGILVTQVLGLRNSENMSLVDEEDELDNPNNNNWIVNRYIDENDMLWSQLSLSLLIQNQEFLHIGQ